MSSGNILRGHAGFKGKSAYDIAVEMGFEGTKEEWLESLTDESLVKVEKSERKAAIETEKTNRTNADNNLQSQINSLASGSPKGVYATTSALVSANPDTGVYVVTADGHIYSWTKNGSSAVDLGVYQATGLSNDRITFSQIHKSITGLKFCCEPTENVSKLLGFSICSEKRFMSKSKSIRIKGKYILHSKSYSWGYIYCKVSGDSYNEQDTLFSIDNNTPIETEISFDKTLSSIWTNALVKTMSFTSSVSGVTNIDFIDLQIIIGDEIYTFFDILNMSLPEYSSYVLDDKSYLANKEYVTDLVNKKYTDVNNTINNLNNALANKILADTLTGIKFCCEPTENVSKLLGFSIRSDKRFMSKSKSIRIKGKYILHSKSYTWSNIVCKISGPNSYNERDNLFSIDNNTPLNKEINFDKTLSEIYTNSSVNAFSIDSIQSGVTNIDFIDLQIIIGDEIYTFFDILSMNLPEYSSYVLDDKSYLADKKYVMDQITSNKEYINTVRDNLLEVISDLVECNEFDVLSKSSLLDIVCWGDSLTAGNYPSALEEHINNNNVHVVNKGVSGETSGTIAFRQGGCKITCTEDFTIPASSSDSVSFSVSLSSGTLKNLARLNTRAKISGILGTITLSNNKITFKRTIDGEIIDVNSGTTIEPIDAELYRDNLAIIWVGRNDMAFSYPDQVTGVISNITAMVSNLSPTIKRFLILPVLNATYEKSNSTGDSLNTYNWIKSLEQQIKTLYPNNYVDIRRYIIDECIYDMGITPTQSDLTNISLDSPPPSIMSDDVHPSNTARIFIARKIYEVMKSKDWIR